MDSPDYLSYGRAPGAAQLLADFGDSQRRTLRLFDHWQALARAMPMLDIVNPPHWEFGHVAWFHEFWVHRHGDPSRPSRIADADALFNSSLVAHRARWQLPLPAPADLRGWLDRVFDDTARLLADDPPPASAYFLQLALFHQDMHNEAFAYSWHTVGWPWPEDLPPCGGAAAGVPGELAFDAAEIDAGAHAGRGFAFDNEKWSHPVQVPAFSIAASAVTQGDYLAYVVEDPDRRTPRDWRCRGGQWERRVHDRWLPLAPEAPVCHVSAVEADAYCRWKGRRLPTEFEWLRLAAAHPSLAFAGIWEWTSSPFAPFPGFRPDPYADYSQPWFDGSYRVLKGASAWTPPRLARAGFRNFYRPERADPFCGFRTCAADSR